MTRKQLAVELATKIKARNNLQISVEKLAKSYLNGSGYMKAFSKAELEKALIAVK